MSASSPTERSGRTAVATPDPLSEGALAAVPGVLGSICRRRAADYRDRPAGSAAGGAAGAFRRALMGQGIAVIAEVKRASPSQGAIADLDPVDAAQRYRRGGAAALSVLTEPHRFGGHLNHLRSVASAVALPVLRKDFVVHPAQLVEAAAAGASAALLIVATLGDALGPYLDYTRALGLDALVEVHDDAELERALSVGADIVGVNNRNLQTLDVDLATAPRLLAAARSSGFDGVLVAESGYRTAAELRPLRGLADAALIGTSLAGSGDLEGALSRLVSELRA